jgi:hypothetical protein
VSLPADPEGQRGAEDLGGEDAGDAGEEAEDERGGALEEDGVGWDERERERVRRDVRRRRPQPQRAPRLPKRRHRRLPVPPVPLPRRHRERRHRERRHPARPAPPPCHRCRGHCCCCFGSGCAVCVVRGEGGTARGEVEERLVRHGGVAVTWLSKRGQSDLDHAVYNDATL